MSYDLLLRRQVSGSVARDDADEGRLDLREVSIERGLLLPAALVLATTATVALALSGGPRKTSRKIERAYYRATRRDLGVTQEMPAVSMRELVYGPREDS
jgi:hypothetical protein